jgi:DNA repair ATPase RecN
MVIDDQNKIKEIARLTSGNADSESAISLAKELLSYAEGYKKTLN